MLARISFIKTREHGRASTTRLYVFESTDRSALKVPWRLPPFRSGFRIASLLHNGEDVPYRPGSERQGLACLMRETAVSMSAGRYVDSSRLYQKAVSVWSWYRLGSLPSSFGFITRSTDAPDTLRGGPNGVRSEEAES